MSRDLERLLEDTAAEPTRPVDGRGIVQRAERHRLIERAAASSAVLVVVAVVIGAVAFFDTNADDHVLLEPPVGNDSTSDELWGRTFVSETVTEGGQPRRLAPDTRIEVGFEQREDTEVVWWWGGCNHMGGPVEVAADRMIIPEDEIMSTTMGCPDSLAAQDAWLDDFFAAGPAWVYGEGRLTLRVDDTVIELREGSLEGSMPGTEEAS